MDWQNPKLQKLKAEWYGKLKASGFEDIEQDETKLKRWSETFFTKGNLNQSHPTVVHAKLDYYSMCRQFAETYQFKNKYDRRVFELHSDGVSIRDIATEINSYRDKVDKTLQRLKKVMRGR